MVIGLHDVDIKLALRGGDEDTLVDLELLDAQWTSVSGREAARGQAVPQPTFSTAGPYSSRSVHMMRVCNSCPPRDSSAARRNLCPLPSRRSPSCPLRTGHRTGCAESRRMPPVRVPPSEPRSASPVDPFRISLRPTHQASQPVRELGVVVQVVERARAVLPRFFASAREEDHRERGGQRAARVGQTYLVDPERHGARRGVMRRRCDALFNENRG